MPFDENDDQHHETPEEVDTGSLGDEDDQDGHDNPSEDDEMSAHGFHVEGEEEEPSDLM
jgi:hypothetical protein